MVYAITIVAERDLHMALLGLSKLVMERSVEERATLTSVLARFLHCQERRL